jgi:flagellar biosynthesis protein FlhB
VFSHGFKITAVATVIMIVYSIIAMKLLFPDMTDMILEKTREELAKKNMSDDQVETTMNTTRKFMLPFMIGFMLLIFMIVGAVSSLIGAAVAKKNPQGPFAQAG